ncbi:MULTISPECIES: helix-turn-helix domain-containing protein [Amycolatopsis]|uniref:Helix-turn-helix domain-containing protein n=1 Tax=Amycolatopsis albidoflavus TaxID=102226 RepID=A0ABW5HX67_9PSEU
MSVGYNASLGAALGLHRNTVMQRLERIAELTSRTRRRAAIRPPCTMTPRGRAG